MRKVKLENWNESEHQAPRYIELDVDHPKNWSLRECAPDDPVNGWFAVFENRLFAVVPGAGDTPARSDVLIFDNVVQILTKDTVISWTVSKRGRALSLQRNGHCIATFEYREPWRYLLHPIRMLRDLILESDWWGIQSDLPSWVLSTAKEPQGLVQALTNWNARRTKSGA